VGNSGPDPAIRLAVVTRRLLAVHAHPDDESITMGGTLASCAARGASVTLVTCTLGEQGEVIDDGTSAPVAGLVADVADQLGGYRWWELRAACTQLGISDSRLLGGAGAYRDSGMAGTASAEHPRAFVRAAVGAPDHDRAVADLVAVIDEVGPQVLLTYDADGGYGHPDHVTAHQVAVAAAAAAGVPRVLAVVRPRAVVAEVLDRFVGPAGRPRAAPDDLGFQVDDALVDVAVPVHWWAPVRHAALAAHTTQLRVFDGGFALSNGIAQPVFDHEYFRVLSGPRPPDDSDAGIASDVFAGLP